MVKILEGQIKSYFHPIYIQLCKIFHSPFIKKKHLTIIILIYFRVSCKRFRKVLYHPHHTVSVHSKQSESTVYKISIICTKTRIRSEEMACWAVLVPQPAVLWWIRWTRQWPNFWSSPFRHWPIPKCRPLVPRCQSPPPSCRRFLQPQLLCPLYSKHF